MSLWSAVSGFGSRLANTVSSVATQIGTGNIAGAVGSAISGVSHIFSSSTPATQTTTTTGTGATPLNTSTTASPMKKYLMFGGIGAVVLLLLYIVMRKR